MASFPPSLEWRHTYVHSYRARCTVLMLCTGRLELHGLRGSPEPLYLRRRAKSRTLQEARRWCNIRRSCPNMHLPTVSSPAPVPMSSLIECSDVLRRRFQINTMSGMGYQYKSIADAIRVIITQEGLKGLYKGITPNLLKVAPSMASSWLTFELTRDFLMTLDKTP